MNLTNSKERRRTVKELKITLAAARKNADMTQPEVAELLGVTVQTLINWEKNRTRIDGVSLQRLSDVYQIPVENIFLPTQ